MTSRRKLFLFIALPLVIIFGVAAAIAAKGNKVGTPSTSTSTASSNKDPWGDTCVVTERGRKELTKSPMSEEKIQIVSPMGLTAGGHVTPIDHMYFYPLPTPGDRFSAEVYAVADGILTSVGHRGDLVDGPADARPGSDEYRLTIEQTCNQGYYYDLITKLAPEIKEQVGRLEKYDTKKMSLTVKAGQLIGYVGNQSLDFGVYDTDVTLGFINPASYTTEPWKIHTADAFAYFSADAYAVFEPKITRFAEPRSGKIDYDKDGYLAGNWFQVGTNGYAGAAKTGGADYWIGHLAFLADAYDPTFPIVSVGTFKGGDPQAFSLVSSAQDPASVNEASGLVKYELFSNWGYYTPTGAVWDRLTPTKGIKGKSSNETKGVMLVQLTGARELKMELFPDKKPSQVTSFTANAKLYAR